MKVILRGNDTVSLELINNVSATETSGRAEVLIKHTTEKSEKEKVSMLVDTRRKLTKEKSEIIANEISMMSSNYKGYDKGGIENVVEEIITSASWSHGHLSVEFSEIAGVTDENLANALAELCWRWPHSHMIKDEQISLRMGVENSEIEKIAKNDAYRTRVRELMIKERTPEEFISWAKPYMGQLGRFGSRMRLTEAESREIFESVATHHGVDISKKQRATKPAADSNGSVDYDVVWGEYGEPDTTKYKVFGRTTVEAPTLNRAKTLATQELNEWLNSEINEKDDTKREVLTEAQKAMDNAVSLHKGKWEEGNERAKRFFGQHMNIWCGMFLGVSKAKK